MFQLKAYSGLIRNHKELASELDVRIEGLSRAQREEALMLAAYSAWGTQMGAHINGQFAAAFVDDETGNVFATRDPLGAELFFYYVTPGGALRYGLQISDLFGQEGFVRELNNEMVQFFLAFNYVPGEETLFRGVYKLEPGGWLTFDKNGLRHGRYWELAFTPDTTKTLDEWSDEIEAAMEASVASLLDVGEVVDSFLSGGVDSSYIVAKSPARTGICVAYENQQASEAAQAQKTAQYLGREFLGVEVSPEDFFGNVDSFLRAYEQPSSDPAGLSLFSAAKKLMETPNASATSATLNAPSTSHICFSGEGADEFFAGYSVYANTTRLRLSPNPVYYGSTYIMAPGEQRRFLKDYCEGRSTRDFMKERGAAGRQYDLVTWMLYTELRSYFEGSILFNSSQIVRGTGLDIRMPFCDLRMLDIALRMPSRFKVGKEGNKIALRAAASRVLPADVAYRKKLGFPVPVRSWMADTRYNADIHRAFESKTARKFFHVDEIAGLLDALEGRTPKVGHSIWFRRHTASLWRYVWTIYIFIRWHEIFFGEA